MLLFPVIVRRVVVLSRALHVFTHDVRRFSAPYLAMMLSLSSFCSFWKASVGSLFTGVKDGQPVGHVDVFEGIFASINVLCFHDTRQNDASKSPKFVELGK